MRAIASTFSVFNQTNNLLLTLTMLGADMWDTGHEPWLCFVKLNIHTIFLHMTWHWTTLSTRNYINTQLIFKQSILVKVR